VKKVLVICGTRPEAIKLAPVVLELRERPREARTIFCATAQHRQMLDEVLDLFGIVPDIDLNVMRPGQHLTDLLAQLLLGLKGVLHQVKPDIVLVQGDTTTVLAGALAAFAERVPVAHVEAGLRTHDRYAPFPEEVNRRAASVIASYHFAPTAGARDNLLAEHLDPSSIFVTGNSVVDALRWAQGRLRAEDLPGYVDRQRRLVLVTAHRRENFGEPLHGLCLTLRRLVEEFPDVQVIYPTHLNPHVQETVRAALDGCERIVVTPPAEYRVFVSLMSWATVILTDSGGVQEEAPALGKPVLVLREVSERPEAIRAGTVRLVGTEPERILAEVRELLVDGEAYRRMARQVNVYGDGLAARRIVEVLLDGRMRTPEFVPEV
jgi:UDP-N-acetylglucosamine 2-epimerase (non-hydrolysing)